MLGRCLSAYLVLLGLERLLPRVVPYWHAPVAGLGQCEHSVLRETTDPFAGTDWLRGASAMVRRRVAKPL